MKYLLILFVCMHQWTYAQEIDPNKRLLELGIQLGEMKAPIANYVKAVQTGKLLYLSGHIPDEVVGKKTRGKLGVQLSVEEGREAARLTAISLLSTLQYYAKNLNNIKRIVKVTGMVNADPAFTQHPAVINGCSDLLVAIFAEKGKHARSAIGMSSLPMDAAVEIEMIVELK
ncbi:MAG: RidA family protein [Bacteroidota bacterium]|jgi:enamine deaminase RidA (YjgF/YER057c/UK114 family)